MDVERDNELAIANHELPPADALAAVKREHLAFQKLLPGLLPEFEGEYVAIYRGEVVGSDADESRLVGKCYEDLGDVPFYIGQVVRNPEVMEVPSPESIP